MLKISLAASSEKLSEDDFVNVHAFCVVEIKTHTPDMVTLTFVEGDIRDPKSDPLLIYSIIRNDNNYRTYCVEYALWNNKVWKVIDDDNGSVLDFLSLLKSLKCP